MEGSIILPPIISIRGYSKSGKTTFICNLLRELSSRSYRVAVVKHDPKGYGLYDAEGTDTNKFWGAGAEAVFLSSPYQFFFRKKVEQEVMPEIFSSLCEEFDLVILEGYKKLNYPFIEIVTTNDDRLLQAGESLALIVDNKQLFRYYDDTICFSRDDISGVADYLEEKGFLVKRRNKW